MRYLAALLFFATLPGIAHAAALSLEVEPAHSPNSYHVTVVLDAPQAINTLEVTLAVPSAFSVGSVSAQSPLGFYWIEPPAYDASARTVHFAGSVPSGWSGRSGKVASFDVTASAPEQSFSAVTFDAVQTHAYRNDGQGSEDALTFGPVRSVSKIASAARHFMPGFLVVLVVLLFAVYLMHKRFRITYQ